MPDNDENVYYRAKSAWSDPMVILNVIALALVNQDVRSVLPAVWIPFVGAFLAIANIIMRVAPVVSDRPVRMNIAPGDSKPVAMKKLD